MVRNIFCLVILFVAAALVWMGGCGFVPPEHSENKTKPSQFSPEEQEAFCKSLKYTGPFRDKWWHYYKRAGFFSENSCWEKAEENLRAAIRRRNKDQWDARSYGMHFLDYFPNRELGIANYYLAKKLENEADGKPLTEAQEKNLKENYENAVKKQELSLSQTENKKPGEKKEDLKAYYYKDSIRKLELSLSQTPSAKTVFYLKKVYKDMIANSRELDGETIKMSSPKIRIDNFQTKDEPVVIAGNIEDETFIKSIYVNDEPVYWLNSLEDFERNLDGRQLSRVEEKGFSKDLKTKVSFKKQLLFMPQGKHPVVIKAENIKGGIRTREIEVHVDRIGPMISVNEIEPETLDKGRKRVKISGFLNDEAGISGLSVNGVSKFAINEKVISIKEEGEKTVSFDETIELDKQDNEVEIVAYDGLGNETSTRIPLVDSMATGGSALFASAGVSDGGNWVANGRDKIIDLSSSIREINLANVEVGYEGEEIRVYQSELPIEIKIKRKKDDKIKLFINEEEKHFIDIKKDGYNIFTGVVKLSKKIKTERDYYKITVKLVNDHQDILEHKDIIIKKEIYKPFSREARLKLFIFPFKYNDNKNIHKISKDFQNRLFEAIPQLHRDDRFQREKIPTINNFTDLDEYDKLKRYITGTINGKTEYAQEKIDPGYLAFTGEIIDSKEQMLKEKKCLGIQIKAKITDTTEDRKIKVPSIDVYDCTAKKSYDDLAKELAAKLHVELPLLLGSVTNRQSNKISTDLEGYDKLRENYKLIVYDQNNKIDGIDGQAIITLVPDAEIIAETEGREIKAHKNKVITQ